MCLFLCNSSTCLVADADEFLEPISRLVEMTNEEGTFPEEFPKCSPFSRSTGVVTFLIGGVPRSVPPSLSGFQPDEPVCCAHPQSSTDLNPER